MSDTNLNETLITTLGTDEIFKEILNLELLGKDIDGLRPAIEHASHRYYEEGSTLFREGAEIDTLFIIRKGRIKLTHHLENGNARIVRLHNQGSLLGLNGLLDETHEHTAMCIDAVETFEIPIVKLRSLKNDDTATYSQLLEYWNQYLHMADKWITEFSTGPVRSRIARLILFLIEHDEVTGSGQTRLLTGEELSEILGVTPESVSRTIAEFKRKGFITATDAQIPNIYRCDVSRLEQEATG